MTKQLPISRYPVYTTYGKMGLSQDDIDTDTVYTHPTSAGNIHIPAGGSAGQVLKYSSSGTAVWGTDDNDAVAMAIALG